MKYVVADSHEELGKNELKEISLRDEEKRNFKAFSSQFSPLASNCQDDFENWELESDIVPIMDITVNKKWQEKYISCHFIVPSYQRGYRWEEEMVSDLLNDIYTNFKKYYDKIKNDAPAEKTWYCIQPLVVKSVPGRLNSFVVIDGQQRLTTIALCLTALNALLPAETQSLNARISLSYESRPESGEFLYSIAEYCADSINIAKQNRKNYTSIEQRIEQTRQQITEPNDIDPRYMLNAYLYAYWYFFERIVENDKAEEYFDFAKQDWKRGERIDPRCYGLFEKMLLEQTAVIWYEIKENQFKTDEHTVFENFNSGKIELTNAELIKGIFMNPDNYLEKPDKAFSQKLETRQIMLGGQWDEIERSLHNPHLWDFMPHLTAPDEDKYSATRIDALLDLYVHLQLEKGNMLKFDEEYFSFKTIDSWINNKLQEDRKTAFDTMLNFWNAIRRVYNTFLEWYNGDSTLKNMNSLYHRMSLLRRVILKTSDTHARRYEIELRELKSVYDLLNSCPKDMRIKRLNKIICKKLGVGKTPDRVRDLIRNTEYDNAQTVEAILLAFNLATLEGAKGYGGRFPFFTYKEEKWEKEHIFATKTVLSGEGEGFMGTLTSDEEINSYKDYRLFLKTGKFSDESDNNNDVYDADDCLENYDKKIEHIKTVQADQTDTQKTHIEKLMKGDGDIINILTDNHIGNMALLPKRNNIIVSNKPFFEKSNEIKEMFVNGDFIPICTMNVFCDFYSDMEGVAKNYNHHWLYQKRVPYIKQMIKSVEEYFDYAGVENDE
jgi:hypothetical protein